MAKEFLFNLADGSPVHKGDVLWHPDSYKVGWYCTAEFKPDDNGEVTVRSPNGAVPKVLISELRRKPAKEKRCSSCGQILPS